MKNKIKVLSILCALLSNNVLAQNSTSANMQATAQLTGACNLTMQSSFSLNVDKTVSTYDIPNFATVKCSRGIPMTVKMSPGLSGDVMQRQMGGTNGNTDRLNYNIRYKEGRDSIIWGEETAGRGGNGYAYSIGNTRNEEYYFNVDIIIPVNQYVKPDTYTDTVIVSVEY